MKQPWSSKQYIFTLFFGLLTITALAEKGKTYHFTGTWDGNSVQIINPQEVGKNKYCIKKNVHKWSENQGEIQIWRHRIESNRLWFL